LNNSRLKSLYSAAKSFLTGRVNLLLFATNRCNSKCTICNLWQEPPVDLSVDAIATLLQSKIINKEGIVLEGGEAIIHPKIRDILQLLGGKDYYYTLLSNGICTELLIDLVRMYFIPSVNISLDGNRETYAKIRGFDGYKSVIASIKRLRNYTELGVCFTISPNNTYEDYLYVKQLCESLGVRLMTNIYCELEYSGKTKEDRLIDERYSTHESPYVRLYNQWVKGDVIIGCSGQQYLCNVFSNGDVSVCQPLRGVVIGNIYQDTIDNIWRSALRKQYLHCNKCWSSCGRYLDARRWKIFH
jgi:MoaA/NifB/PqqE/SkfB family radical SAM enzyme